MGLTPKSENLIKNTLGLPSPVFNRRQVVQFLGSLSNSVDEEF